MLRRHPREYDARSRALIILYFNRRYIRWKSKLRSNPNKGTLPPSDKLGFGHYFTDHMFVMDYTDAEGWHDARIVPYGPISLSPAASVFHYGTEVFEGLKAYRTPGRRACSCSVRGTTCARLNTLLRPSRPSAHRPRMTALRGHPAPLVKLDQDWVPSDPGTSLYIRPFLFSTDPDSGAARRA